MFYLENDEPFTCKIRPLFEAESKEVVKTLSLVRWLAISVLFQNELRIMENSTADGFNQWIQRNRRNCFTESSN